MKEQPYRVIVRVHDLRGTPRPRVNVQLECRHIVACPWPAEYSLPVVGGSVRCPFCALTEAEVQQAKTAQQLYKEAGEP